jgi:hypothetical protein
MDIMPASVTIFSILGSGRGGEVARIYLVRLVECR